MTVTFVIGRRSRSKSYGSLLWVYGCAVKVEAGANSSVWSSAALMKALMATRPSPPGRFSTTTGLPQRVARRSSDQPGGDVDAGRRSERQDESHRPLRIAFRVGRRGCEGRSDERCGEDCQISESSLGPRSASGCLSRPAPRLGAENIARNPHWRPGSATSE